MGFNKGQIVRVCANRLSVGCSPAVKTYYVQVESGPFWLAANDNVNYYDGWTLLAKGDPYAEPYKVTFPESSATIALDEDVERDTQGRINFTYIDL